MKSTSAVALIISTWVFSGWGWGWGVAHATEPSLGSSFEEWCQQKARLSAEAKRTVEALLEQAGTSDCEVAANNLSSCTELILVSKEITNISPLAGLTNLTDLILGQNQIKDVGPLARLTNLTTLYLENNQITDVSPLAELTNLYGLYLTGNPLSQPVCPVSPPDICRF